MAFDNEWIDSRHEQFESTMERVAAAIARDDPRFGIHPQRRKKRRQVDTAILLISDLGQRTRHESAVLRVAILQHANTVVLEDGLRGTLDALTERGFRDGERLRIERFNAQGDMPTGIAIARQITGGSYDLVITSSTPSMQAVANSNREGRVRHVFTLVADPFASGVGLDRAHPLNHPPHLVGQSIFPPVERAFQLARRMLPTLTRIGVAWNPAEANSLAFVTKAREVAGKMNLTLLEANVDNTSAVTEALSFNRFEDVRRAEQLDESAAEMLQRLYV